MKKPTCPYSYPHKSRKAKVDYICGIGGYSTRHNRYPVEFSVALYDVDNDFDSLWKEILKQNPQLPEDPDCDSLRIRAGMLWAEKSDNYYEWAQECAARSLSEEDCDAYHMLWDGTMLSVKLALEGRGGKHLVITAFEGHELTNISDDALAEEMMERDSDGSWTAWSTENVDKFYKYVRQCEVDFTPKKASAEVMYLMSSDLHLDAEEAVEEQKKILADRERLEEAVQIVSTFLAKSAIDDSVTAAWVDLRAAVGVN